MVNDDTIIPMLQHPNHISSDLPPYPNHPPQHLRNFSAMANKKRNKKSRSKKPVPADLPNRRTTSLTHDIDSDDDLVAIRQNDESIMSGGVGTIAPSDSVKRTLASFHDEPDTPFDDNNDNDVLAGEQAREDEITADASRANELDDDDEEGDRSVNAFQAAQARVDEMATGLRERRLKTEAQKARGEGEQPWEALGQTRAIRGEKLRPEGETTDNMLAGGGSIPVPVAIALIMLTPFAMMLLVMWWHQKGKSSSQAVGPG